MFFYQCEPFAEPVNTKEFTDYLDYVFHPMDLNTLEKNVKKRIYGSTEVSDCLHDMVEVLSSKCKFVLPKQHVNQNHD